MVGMGVDRLWLDGVWGCKGRCKVQPGLSFWFGFFPSLFRVLRLVLVFGLGRTPTSTAVVVFPSHPRVSIRDAKNSHMWPAQPMCDQLPLVAPPLPSQSQNEQGDGRIRISSPISRSCTRLASSTVKKGPPVRLSSHRSRAPFVVCIESKIQRRKKLCTHPCHGDGWAPVLHASVENPPKMCIYKLSHRQTAMLKTRK